MILELGVRLAVRGHQNVMVRVGAQEEQSVSREDLVPYRKEVFQSVSIINGGFYVDISRSILGVYRPYAVLAPSNLRGDSDTCVAEHNSKVHFKPHRDVAR
jgi:hypothetical protein